LSLHAGDHVSLLPEPARIHRFDASGSAIRG
jgi:multiple sugar transport system ATP-binding protein